MLTHRLITTFHYVVREQSGNDVTIARAKTMIALASLTWPSLGIVVTPFYITPGRLTWKSEAFESVMLGGGFRRDPVGDDASIIIDDYDPDQLIMLDKMQDCAGFIPLFGRQRLERFNLTLAELFLRKTSGAALPLPGSEESRAFNSEDHYRRLYEWLVSHGAITSDGQWQSAGEGQLS
ncbi:hypothetical protein EHM76_01825 [bacterium]|nr:MAG: hypothetical protein EHM76_01825 [bacterium]